MTLDITIDGSGEVGHVASWSVKESATQHSLAQSSGSVGSLDITAAAVVSGKSAYLNDCGISVSDGTGAWSGRIMDAPTSGAAVTVKAEGALRFLNAVRTAPPAGRFLTPESIVTTLASVNGLAWDASGNLFIADADGLLVRKFSESSPGVWAQVAVTAYSSSGSADGQFGTSGPWGVACDASGNVYVTDPSNSRVQKFTNGLVFTAKQGSAGSGDSQYNGPVGIAYNAATGHLHVMETDNVRVKVIDTSLAYVSKTSTGDNFTEIAVDASGNSAWSGNTVGPAVTYYVTSGGAATPSFRQSVSVAFDPLGNVWAAEGSTLFRLEPPALTSIDFFSSFGTGLGLARSIWRIAINSDGRLAAFDIVNGTVQTFTNAGTRADNTAPLSEVIESYIRLCDPDSDHAYSYDCANDPDVNFPGWTDTVWRKLNELCAVYNIEIYYQAGTVHVGDIGARELDISNTTVPTRTPESIQPARSVQVVNQNIVAGDGLTMYDAADVNTIHTVDVGAVRVITLATNNHPASLNYPTPIDAAPIGAGQYCVQDSTGAAIDAADWTAAGGNVTVAVGEATGTIVLTITGPTATIAGTTAPYSLASGTGTSRVATLSITGSGVTTNPQIVTVGTGADPARIKQEVARTIDVPFIGTLGRAYDAGVWAACDSLFGLTLKFRIPRESGKTFGDYAGRKFTWGNAQWRVTDATIDVGGVDITARWHTTVGEFDAAWSGETVGDLDAEWANYLARDVTVTPLATDLP